MKEEKRRKRSEIAEIDETNQKTETKETKIMKEKEKLGILLLHPGSFYDDAWAAVRQQ